MTAIATSQGTTFSFNSVTFSATNVKVSKSVNEVDVSTLDLTAGSMRTYQVAPLVDGDVISLTYFGATRPDMTGAHAITCETLGISGTAICTKFSADAKVGELLMGDAEFRLVSTGS
jgi:hypothetical protein